MSCYKHCGIWTCRSPGNKRLFVKDVRSAASLHDPGELGSCISPYSVPMKCTRMWMYTVTCLISSHVIWEQSLCRFWRLHSTYLQHIWLTTTLQFNTALNSLMTSVTSLKNAVFTLFYVPCCLNGRMIMYGALKIEMSLPSLTPFECIYGHHVCNYSVNLKQGSVLFFSLWHMELTQPIIAYFAIGNYRVGSSLVYTHTRFLCPLMLFTALLLNGRLCVTLVEPQGDSVL